RYGPVPRSPATSPAQYPAASGVGVSVLLRQAHGFEGFRLAHIELLVDQQPVPVGEEPCNLAEGHLYASGAPVHPHVEQHDYAVPGINQLVLEFDGLPGGKPLSPEPANGIRSPVDPS